MPGRVFAVAFFATCFLVTSTIAEEPSLTVISSTYIINRHENRAIYCKGTNVVEPPTWYDKDGNEVTKDRLTDKPQRIYVEKSKGEDASKGHLIFLFIKKAEAEDSGNWTCKSGDLTQTVQVVVGEKVVIPKRYEEIDAKEGNNIDLECQASGMPAPVVQWYKDMTPITEDNEKFKIKQRGDTHTLMVKKLTYNDSATYMCKVTQGALQHYTDKRITLKVIHKPFMVDHITGETLTSEKEVYGIYNETKNITCKAVAYPPPTITWVRVMRNNYEVPIDVEDTVITSPNNTDSVLMLRLYSEEDFGLYKCNVFNSHGRAAIVFHVTVGNKPNMPDSAVFVKATNDTITFNVTCSSCNFQRDPSVESSPENLTVTDYSFELSPVVVVPDITLPDWDDAVEIEVSTLDKNNTLYDVGPLPNKTKFYVRVRTKNLAGYSDWLNIDGHPATISFGNILSSMSSVLLLLSVCTSLF